jgi:glycerate kinase
MKIVLAPDKFKDSLSAIEVCDNLIEGLSNKNSNYDYISCPMADGGEGSLEILKYYLDLEPIDLIVNDPLFRPVKSTYYVSKNTAFIEMSSASGLVLLNPSDRNPMFTSSIGTGELIQDAINRGFKNINLFIGGSATNDGAIGIAHALGYRFYDTLGNLLSPVGKNLIKIDTIDSRSESKSN